MIKIGIVQFPGSNCERETTLAVQRSGMKPVNILWTTSADELESFDGFILIGGFSFEDRLRAGAIAAKSKLMKHIITQAQLGKPVLGICNGAQILVESGLVPGIVDQNNQPLIKIALVYNLQEKNNQLQAGGYFNDWCYIKSPQTHFYGEQNTILNIPFAHAQGRFVFTEETYRTICEAGVNIWQYCTKNGEIKNTFPNNPNGSQHNIAAISNIAGNVLAMMPHPERTPNGDNVFLKMRDSISQKKINYHTLMQKELPTPLKTCKLTKEHVITQLQIADNEAASAQQTLATLGYPVTLKKWTTWQIQAPPPHIKDTILATNELSNPNKEFICHTLPKQNNYFLVVNNIDIQGQYLKNLLINHYHIEDLKKLQRGILWGISNTTPKTIIAILNTHILHNPISQTIYKVTK